MKQIPSAEDFIINKLNEKYPNENRPPSPKDVEEWLIEFAEMHVKEALKKIKNSVFVIQNKNNMLIHGCFKTKEKAKKYINGNVDYAMIKLGVE